MTTYAEAVELVQTHLDGMYAAEPESPKVQPEGFDTGDAWAPAIDWDGVLGVYIYLVDKTTGELTPRSFPEFEDDSVNSAVTNSVRNHPGHADQKSHGRKRGSPGFMSEDRWLETYGSVEEDIPFAKNGENDMRVTVFDEGLIQINEVGPDGSRAPYADSDSAEARQTARHLDIATGVDPGDYNPRFADETGAVLRINSSGESVGVHTDGSISVTYESLDMDHPITMSRSDAEDLSRFLNDAADISEALED